MCQATACLQPRQRTPRPDRGPSGPQALEVRFEGRAVRAAETCAWVPARLGVVGPVAAGGDVEDAAPGPRPVEEGVEESPPVAGSLAQQGDQPRPPRGAGAGAPADPPLARAQDVVGA